MPTETTTPMCPFCDLKAEMAILKALIKGEPETTTRPPALAVRTVLRPVPALMIVEGNASPAPNVMCAMAFCNSCGFPIPASILPMGGPQQQRSSLITVPGMRH